MHVTASSWYLDKEGVIRKVSLSLFVSSAEGQRRTVCGCGYHGEFSVASKSMLCFDWSQVAKLGKADWNATPAVCLKQNDSFLSVFP